MCACTCKPISTYKHTHMCGWWYRFCFHMPKQHCPLFGHIVTRVVGILAVSWSGNARQGARPDLNNALSKIVTMVIVMRMVVVMIVARVDVIYPAARWARCCFQQYTGRASWRSQCVCLGQRRQPTNLRLCRKRDRHATVFPASTSHNVKGNLMAVRCRDEDEDSNSKQQQLQTVAAATLFWYLGSAGSQEPKEATSHMALLHG